MKPDLLGLVQSPAQQLAASGPTTKAFYTLPLKPGVSLDLHVMRAGSGPPLIMVPATISELENWVTMVRFLAQWFTVYFFELPGHGKSQAFPTKFTTDQVAVVVEKLADSIGAQQFSLMGFSFGGILAMKSFQRLARRIERLILISPCLTHRALYFSERRKALLIHLAALVARPTIARGLLNLMHSQFTVETVVSILRRVGSLEDTIADNLKAKFLALPATTLDVLSWQLQEALTIEFTLPEEHYTTPCYFAMSRRDPLIDYMTTLAVAQAGFRDITVTTLDYPYHQPPRPFTFDELNRDFGRVVSQALSVPTG